MPKRRTTPPENASKPLALPLPDEGIGSEAYWVDEVEQAAKRIKDELPLWQANLSRYKGQREHPGPGSARRDGIIVNVDFYNVEQKKAQLFFQTPAVQLKPEQTGLENAAPLFQAVINETLGPDEVDAKRLLDEILMDVLCPSGFGVTKIGYDRIVGQVELPTGRTEPVLDPLTGVPAVDPMTGQPQTQLALDPRTGQPETAAVPKTIWSQYYWRRISPENLRLPVGFLSTRYDEAPFLGFRFPIGEAMAREFGLTDQAAGSGAMPDETLAGSHDRKYLRSMTMGVEIWYRAYLYDAGERNPERIRRLVLLERGRGRSAVLVHENSPYQKFDPQTGEFIQGMRGYPIHILALRPLSDSAFPPSDCTVSRHQVDELSKGRTQMIRQRDRNIPVRGVNTANVRKETITQLERAEVQSIIKFNGPIQDSDFKELAPAGFPPENFGFNAEIQRDIDRLWALGANQQGLQQTTGRTATELSLIQQATDTRLAYERERVLSWYLQGVEKLSTLLQMFADHDAMVRIVGEDGAQRLATWNKQQIQGRYAFTAKPDSAVRVNAAEEREMWLRFFNLVANHPLTNAQELMKQLALRFNLDPAKMIQAAPPPPQPKEEKPKVSISIKGEDLNPLMPQYANIVMLLGVAGVNVQTMVPPQPSAVPIPPDQVVRSPRPVPPVNAHDTERTGMISGPGPRQPQ